MANVTAGKLIEVFGDTEKFYTEDETLKVAVQKSVAYSKFYGANDYPSLPERRFDKTVITVNKCRTFEAAIQLHKNNPDARIAVHNFASATNPGGGVAHGSRAQEEALCRCSTLYPVLNTDENLTRYYNFHRQRKDTRYTDACIYAPDIVICKSDVDIPQRLPQKDWVIVDVMTCAAPNLRVRPNNKYNPGHDKPVSVDDEELLALHESRARHMLTVLAHHGVDIFVTGAFGCGAFRNKPAVVAQAYKNILPDFDGVFKEFVFAVYCSRDKTNYEAFNEVLT